MFGNYGILGGCVAVPAASVTRLDDVVVLPKSSSLAKAVSMRFLAGSVSREVPDKRERARERERTHSTRFSVAMRQCVPELDHRRRGSSSRGIAAPTGEVTE